MKTRIVPGAAFLFLVACGGEDSQQPSAASGGTAGASMSAGLSGSGGSASAGGSSGAGGSPISEGGLSGSGGGADAVGGAGRRCNSNGDSARTSPVPRCRTNDECLEGECVEIISGYRACVRVRPGEALEACRNAGPANAPADECRCPGQTCEAEETCRSESIYLGAASGAPLFRNVCGRDECQSNADCDPGQVCEQPLEAAMGPAFNRCRPADCLANEDCKACGVCTPLRALEQQGQQLYSGVSCF